jgi:hypothetical protein
VAVVEAAAGFAKVTVPGPETLVHAAVTAPGGLGRPSSLAEPASVAAAGIVTSRSGPASAVGAWFPALTTTVTSSEAVSVESSAVSRSW